ncbi:helix-turn-helix domain-containing protein [Blastochloris sulfoviridis]|uniref:Helix-turn-helix domain-containing protein n=1 Tax=Blastochloris sulfoviridis TaxID=50712 RepID=A0A5M6HVC7_9HYPH|nr:helix-turn-helix domain-containing protein [Blastochloris sulfoviridis]KAA5599509.1 helix-turn-helix domain-containing protein [Blastochloris sulfoviridis]
MTAAVTPSTSPEATPPHGQRWHNLAWTQEQRCGSPAAKVVLMVLAEHSDADGWSRPSIGAIADITEQSAGSVRRGLAESEKLGLIARLAGVAGNGRQMDFRSTPMIGGRDPDGRLCRGHHQWH